MSAQTTRSRQSVQFKRSVQLSSFPHPIPAGTHILITEVIQYRNMQGLRSMPSRYLLEVPDHLLPPNLLGMEVAITADELRRAT